jgi:hypothetical protein
MPCAKPLGEPEGGCERLVKAGPLARRLQIDALLDAEGQDRASGSVQRHPARTNLECGS